MNSAYADTRELCDKIGGSWAFLVDRAYHGA